MSTLTVNDRRLLFEWLFRGKAKKLSFKVKVYKVANGHSHIVMDTTVKAYSITEASNYYPRSRFPFLFSSIVVIPR